MELARTITVLPSAVHVPLRIMQLYRSRSSPGIDKFAEVIVADAALSGKVLQLANSAWFSRTRTITKISDALRMIGLNNLLPLLFGLSLSAIFNKTNLSTEDRSALWRNAVVKATIAREFTRWRGDAEQAEEAFLCGVLQDIALPIMYAADRAAAMELAGVIDLDGPARAERETSLYGADHASFGRDICTQLQLPELYIVATAAHHASESADLSLPEPFQPLVSAIRLAAAFPHASTRLDEHAARRVSTCLIQLSPGMHPGEASEFIERAAEAIRGMLALLVPQRPNGSGIKSFLQDVSDEVARTLLSAIGHANQTIEQLQSEQAQLESQVHELEEQVIRAEYDTLTGVLSRGGFFARAGNMLALARKLSMGCAVGFVDMDDFKSVNDRNGHHAGDEALVTLASALRQTIHNRGMVGRCGGDEFAFVMVVPQGSGREAVCDEIERAIAALSIPTAHGQLRISASLGVAWLGVPDPSQSIEAALKLADQQMYECKRNAGQPQRI